VHVIIVGCGRVGSALARDLVEDGTSVAVLDRRREAFRRLPADFSGEMIVGVGFDRARLRSAGVERADAVAAVTSGDNSNILTARVAREAFGVERVVARIYDTKRAAIYERLGIPTVAATGWTADRVRRTLLPAPGEPVWSVPQAGVVVLERPVERWHAGKPLADLEAGGLGRIVALGRNGSSALPEPAMAAQEGDVVWVAVADDDVDDYDRTVAAASGGGASASEGAH
jgi:trk system potassium uptake protein TrkA